MVIGDNYIIYIIHMLYNEVTHAAVTKNIQEHTLSIYYVVYYIKLNLHK